jgi:predicted DNA-binding antitoxin AbrB/MazE fold protein
MSKVEAVFQGGMFKPLGRVMLPENQLVRLSIEPIARQEAKAWLDSMEALHNQVIVARGILPDSAPDIAADRVRDE